ncbi:ABC transporter permease [Rhodococcoides yunnanense]|uniref:ABC transporter permease n=1 Tax=Rhodococcoides yunnanense TaxID=278209 RepID=A0ABU4BE23_9NOCA|nr:ABC transporter permease [Rhodococcus yunnanensis]MDV6262344.1 ABC transporter permease [Rhodococcus yunnanensis]
MIWVTWRQFRATILFGVLTPLALAAITVAITVFDGGVIPTASLSGCLSFEATKCRAETAQAVAIMLTVVLPVVLGAFVGVTVFSRDLERRTHVLGLSQSVSRRRWYTTRVAVVFVPTVLAMTLLGCSLYWAKYQTAPDEFAVGFGGYDSALEFPVFGATGFVAGGYTAIGLMLGAALALALRNTVAAMIGTVIATSLLISLFPTQIREHFAAASVEELTLEQKSNEMYGGGTPDFSLPLDSSELFYARWVFSSDYVDADGRPVAIDWQQCGQLENRRDMSEFETVADYEEYSDGLLERVKELQLDCFRAQGADAFETKYHEDRLFWRFQAIETALSLLIAGLFGGLSLLLVRRLRP